MALGPKYYDINGFWVLKPRYLGFWTLRGNFPFGGVPELQFFLCQRLSGPGDPRAWGKEAQITRTPKKNTSQWTTTGFSFSPNKGPRCWLQRSMNLDCSVKADLTEFRTRTLRGTCLGRLASRGMGWVHVVDGQPPFCPAPHSK